MTQSELTQPTMQITLLDEQNGPKVLAILPFEPDWMPDPGDELEIGEYGEFVVVRRRWSYFNRCREKHLVVIVERMQ